MNDAQMIHQYKSHVGNLDGVGHYILAGRTSCDVFSGNGWNPPTRFRKVRGAWVYQQGPRLSPHVLDSV